MVAEYIKEKIELGEYIPGALIKTEREYARRFHLSKSRVHRELRSLVNDGYLESRRGSGYRVADRKVSRASWRIAFLGPVSDISSGLGEEGAIFLMKARDADMKLELFPHRTRSEPGEIEDMMRQIISGRECDAAIINPATEHDDYKKAVLAAYEKRFPVIWRDFNPTIFPFSGVGPNHFEIGALAANILHSKGYGRTLFLGHARSVGDITYDAFSMCAENAGLEHERLDFRFDGFDEMLRKKIMTGNFDSVFACTSFLSNVAYSHMSGTGVDMPDDIGLLTTRRAIFDTAPSPVRTDSVMIDNELYADRLITITKDAAVNAFPKESHIIKMSPRYLPGETLKTNRKRHK